MKKRKFITVLSAAMLTAVALGSCSIVKSKAGVVLIYDGKEYTADQLYEGEKTPAAAEAKFKAVYKVAVRRYFEEGQPGHQFMEQITNDTKNKISGQKATAQSNADKNGTSYDTEWDKILTSNNVEDEQGLYDKFEYDLQKEKFDDKFYENNYEALRDGKEFVDEDGKGSGIKLPKGYLDSKQPYHMKHILVKLANAKDGNNTSVEISKDEAIKLYNVVTHLANGMSFKDVSDIYSDDESARDSHSSLGIMSRDTSFVNDFKLGTYLYEAFYGSSTQSETDKSKNAKEKLGLTEDGTGEDAGHFAKLITELQDPTTSKGIGEIPFELFEALGENQYDDPSGGTKRKEGLANIDLSNEDVKNRFLREAQLTEGDVKSKFLPRNVLFNKYLNKHNINVITPTKLPTTETRVNYIDSNGQARTNRPEDFKLEEVENYRNKNGFKQKAKNNDEVIGFDNKPVLRDENGRVILVFRSGSSGDSGYQGVHFVVIERSPFIKVEQDREGEKYFTTLEEYYTHFYPGQANGKHPVYDGTVENKHTYVNYVMGETDIKKLKARADSVKSELKKADTHLDKYIYDYLVKKGQLTFASTDQGKEIEQTITNWIDISKEATKIDEKKSWDNTWRTYYNSLEAASEQRQEQLVGTEMRSYLVTEACVDAFLHADSVDGSDHRSLKTMFGAGGIFHE